MKVGKESFIRSASVGPKNLAEHEFVDFIPEEFIRKCLWIPIHALGEPLYRCLRQFVQTCRAQPLLAGDKQRPILGTERMVHRWTTWLREGRGNISSSPVSWEKRRPMGQARGQVHLKGRPTMT